MEAKYGLTKTAVIQTLVFCLTLALAIWPPKQSNGQNNGEYIERPGDRSSQLIHKIDSLNHAIKIEVDLYYYMDSLNNTAPKDTISTDN